MTNKLLKRSHEEITPDDNTTIHASSPSSSTVVSTNDENLKEPERKKIKPSATAEEFIEATKYWYHIIANLECDQTNYKSLFDLERGLKDREEIIENIGQLWHVHEARLILESLDLENPYWNEDWFELTNNAGELSTDDQHLYFPEQRLRNKVAPSELGLTSEIAQELLKEYIGKREDIESHSLVLMEKLFKKCAIQSAEEVTEMIEKCFEIDARNEESFFYQLELNGDTKLAIENWCKNILPEIVEAQNELNLNYETRDEDSIRDRDAKLLIEHVEDEELEMGQEEDEIASDCVYCTYLFDLQLPDEKGKIGSNFLGMLHTDHTNSEENVFLKMLETVMKMHVSGETPQEHQEIEVSELRLAVSLMILDCLNKELTYLILSQRKEKTYILYRPLVRSILDQFIVDYCDSTKYDKYMFVLSTNPDIPPMVNVLFSDDVPLLNNENLVWDVVQPLRGHDDWSSARFNERSDSDSEGSDEEFETNHPIWENSVEGLKDNYFTHEAEAHSQISAKKLDESMYITYYTDEKKAVSEPISHQNLVSFFKPDNIEPLDGETETYDDSHDNLIENRSIDCYYKDDKSLHLDLVRILRRSGVYSFDEGSILEGYSTLRNYIALFLKNLEEVAEDGVVEVAHIKKIAKLLTSQESTKVKEHLGLEAPFYYKLDYTQQNEPAKDVNEANDSEIDLLNTQKIKLEEETVEGHDEFTSSLGKDLSDALRDEQLSTLCDSFVQTEDGTRIGVFTPIIKFRLPEVYQFFDTEEKRKNGFCINSEQFIVEEGETLVFDTSTITKWLTCIYTGISEKINSNEPNSLSLAKLLAKWPLRVDIIAQADESSDEDEDEYDEQDDDEEDDEEEGEEHHKSGDEIDQDDNEDNENETEENQDIVDVIWRRTRTTLVQYIDEFGNVNILQMFNPVDEEGEGGEEYEGEEDDSMDENDEDEEDMEFEETIQKLEEESESEEPAEVYYYSDEDTTIPKIIKEEIIRNIEAEPLGELFLDDESKDFSLITNGFKIKVHKYILGMRCSYFKVLFSGNFSDSNISEYDVSDFLKNSQAVELFIYFLYHDRIINDTNSFTKECYQNLIDLQEFSSFVMNEKLESECIIAMSSPIDLEQSIVLLKESLASNNQIIFNIAHNMLLKTTNSFFTDNIIDEATTKYYQIMCTSLTLENALVKLEYLNRIEKESLLHPFILHEAKLEMENLHWFIANRASSLDSELIRTLPQPIQELTARFFTHDNLGMASFEPVNMDDNSEAIDISTEVKSE